MCSTRKSIWISTIDRLLVGSSLFLAIINIVDKYSSKLTDVVDAEVKFTPKIWKGPA